MIFHDSINSKTKQVADRFFNVQTLIDGLIGVVMLASCCADTTR